MKKLLFLLAIFCTLKANAQPYSISFSGTGLSTVKVQNLTSDVVIDVPAGDVLLLSTPTGIPEVNNLKSSGLKVYPNPMNDKSTIEILPPVAGDAIISVCDMTGKVIIQFKGYVDNSIQEFSISGIKNGLHIINIQGNGYQFSEKLLSNGKFNGTAGISKLGNNIQVVSEKKSIDEAKGVQNTVDMAYTAGDRLKFTGTSGIFSTVLTDIPASDKTITFDFIACTDADNNNYPVVKIGTQVWMAENLKTTKYSTGDLIGTTTPATLDISGLSAPKYQWAPAGDESNVTTYGRLYTWYSTTDNRNVCPTGWHVPTDAEWNVLETYLGGMSIAGAKLKETGTANWAVPNTGATNEIGFTALPAGIRYLNGPFSNLINSGYWWCSTDEGDVTGLCRLMSYCENSVEWVGWNKRVGLSVRCLQ
ncbi:MAG: FISUMP domain-containing protein [Bacteroidales bacterium]